MLRAYVSHAPSRGGAERWADPRHGCREPTGRTHLARSTENETELDLSSSVSCEGDATPNLQINHDDAAITVFRFVIGPPRGGRDVNLDHRAMLRASFFFAFSNLFDDEGGQQSTTAPLCSEAQGFVGRHCYGSI